MKLVHSAATLAQDHSNIWMMTVLVPEGARASCVAFVTKAGAANTGGRSRLRRAKADDNISGTIEGQADAAWRPRLGWESGIYTDAGTAP